MLLETQNTFKNFFSSGRNFIKNHSFATILLTALLLAHAFLLKYLLLFGWDPQDYGGLLSGAWRILHGQKLYIDFYFHAVPLHLYILAAFLGLFGFSKAALWAAVVFDSTLASLIVFWGSRHLKLSLPLCFLTTILTLAGFHLGRTFPLYDHYAPFWGICGIWLLAANIPFKTNKHAFLICFAAGFFALLSVMTKISDGLAFGLALLCTILCVREYRPRAFWGYFWGCLIGLIVTLLLIPDFQAFFQQNFIYYNSGQVGRLRGFLSIKNLLAHGYFIPLTILCYAIAKDLKQNIEHIALVAGVTFVAIFSYILGSEKNLSHIPVMGTLAALVLGILWKALQTAVGDRKKKLRISFALMIIFCFVQIFICISWAVIKRSPSCRHKQYGLCYERKMTIAPLEGWKAYFDWSEAIENMAFFIKAKVPKNESILMLADFQIMDMLANRTPYKGVPFQFVLNIAPKKGKQVEQVRQNIMSNPPDWILTYKDNSPFVFNALLVYLGIESFVVNRYVPVWGTGGYFICRRRMLPPKHPVNVCYSDGSCPKTLQDALTNWLSQ